MMTVLLGSDNKKSPFDLLIYFYFGSGVIAILSHNEETLMEVPRKCEGVRGSRQRVYLLNVVFGIQTGRPVSSVIWNGERVVWS